jgi:hypothetical protein
MHFYTNIVKPYGHILNSVSQNPFSGPMRPAEPFFRSYAARRTLFLASCGPQTLKLCQCGPQASLVLRPLGYTYINLTERLLSEVQLIIFPIKLQQLKMLSK